MRIATFEAHGAWAEARDAGAKVAFVAGLDVLALAGSVRGALAALVIAASLLASCGHARRLRLALFALPFLALNTLLVAAALPGSSVAAFGPVAFSREGLAAGGLAALRLVAVLASAQWFLATTAPARLLALVAWWPTLSVSLGAALAALPSVEADARRLASAARVRGLASGPSTWAQLAPALAVATARRGAALGDALEAAGWDGRLERYGRRRWRALDLALAGAGCAAALVALAGWI